MVQIEIERKKIQGKMMKNLEELVFPVLHNLRRRGSRLDQRQIDVLEQNLRNITSDFGSNIAAREWGLSSREIEVCNLIKEKMSTKEIADILCTSTRTIDNHRNRIRKKMGISKDKISLVAFLQSLNRDF